MGFLQTAGKILLTSLIAATGVGIYYLLKKTIIINDGYCGISYNGGRLKILEPGLHLLLSPLHVFKDLIPFQKDQVVRLKEFEIKTADGVPAIIQIDFTYQIENAQKAIVGVDNYKEALKEAVKGAISLILQVKNYDQLNSAQLVRTVVKASPRQEEEKAPAPSPAYAIEEAQQLSQSLMEQTKAALQEVCERWGISISRIRLISVDAKDNRISNEIAETSLSQLRANNQLLAAKAKADALGIESQAEARAKQTLAGGEAQAFITMAQARVSAVQFAAKQLLTPEEIRIYEMQTSLETARALSNTNGTLALGTNPFPLFAPARTGLLAPQQPLLAQDQTRSRSRANLSAG